MRKTRVVARLTAVMVMVFGLGLVTAGPAAAVPDTGVWRSYGNTNPITSSTARWSCNRSEPIVSGVSAQVCTIRSASGIYVQGAVIVRNDRSGLFFADAVADLSIVEGLRLGQWECTLSGVGVNSWSVCFGGTRYQPAAVYSYGELNAVPLGYSPGV